MSVFILLLLLLLFLWDGAEIGGGGEGVATGFHLCEDMFRSEDRDFYEEEFALDDLVACVI